MTMDIAPIIQELKTISAKSSVIWGVALASIILWVGDKYIAPLDLPTGYGWVLPVVTVVSWCIIFTGMACQAWGRIANRRERRALRKIAVRSIRSLPREYQQTLLWMLNKEMRFVAVDSGTEPFGTLYHEGYLDKEGPNKYRRIETYTIPDEIWHELKKIDISRINFPANPPWSQRSWMAV